MKYLLDTNVLLWWLADDPKLSPRHRAWIADAENRVLVSSVSLAEIAIKASLGKLTAPDDIADEVLSNGFELLSFDAAHAASLRGLPWHHRDPFDRMLVAQADIESCVLLTVDRRIAEYGVPVG